MDWDRAERLFHELTPLSPEARAEVLLEITSRDPDLGSEIKALLEAHDATHGPLDSLNSRLSPHSSDVVSPAAESLTGRSIDHYDVGALIGRGGMGEVYRARDRRLGREVALKFLPRWMGMDPAARERFLVEARVVSSIDDTNVCTLLELGETADGRLFLIMPYYEGETLKERLRRGPLAPAAAVDVALQTARGLAAAHRHGIVHRDVKPANLLLTGDGRVKILDFGIAKLADVNLTRSGQQPGTLSYMAPEQLRGEPVDARTDLWALGLVLHEMLTGRRPAVPGAGLDASSSAELPRGLASVVERLLSTSPDARYPDTASLVRDLEVLAAGDGALEARPVPWFRRLFSELKRRNVFRVAAVYGALGYGVIQVADVMFPRVGLAEWAVTLIVWLVILGFPIALVLAWAFETTPTGVRRTRSVRPAMLDAIARQPIRRRWPAGLAGLAGAALLLAGGWMALAGGAPSWWPFAAPAASGPGISGGEAVTIAVVAVESSGDRDIGEGLAGLLARGLDNVPGLRSAPENLVLRSWQARDETLADSLVALDVARSVGANAAIVLASSSVGPTQRIEARVYPVPPFEIDRGWVRVQGDEAGLIDLIDELGVKLVAKLTPDSIGGTTSIAAVSTRSLPAMRAFLLGEERMRRADYQGAAREYRRAVEADSTFGLAWHELQVAYGWTGDLDLSENAGHHAAAHADQMPERERLIVLAYEDLSSRDGRLEDLEDAARRYPGDWEILEALSEMYLHDAWHGGVSPRVADSVRVLAAAAAPDNPKLLIHGIDLALGFYRDSVLARRRIAHLESVTGQRAAVPRLLFDMVFFTSDPGDRRSRIDGLPNGALTGFPFPLAHPLTTPRRVEVNRAVVGRDLLWPIMEPDFFTQISLGRLDAALRTAAAGDTTPLAQGMAPRAPACYAYLLRLAGVDLAGTEAATWLDDAAAESEPDVETMLCTGGDAVDGRRWAAAEARVAGIRKAGETATDSLQRRRALYVASALDTYLRWARDPSVESIPRSTRLAVAARDSWPIRWWTARMLSDQGRLQEALDIYESYWFPAWVPAFLERAELEERLGRTEEARDLYDVVLTVWADADPLLQPLVERARVAVARLR